MQRTQCPMGLLRTSATHATREESPERSSGFMVKEAHLPRALWELPGERMYFMIVLIPNQLLQSDLSGVPSRDRSTMLGPGEYVSEVGPLSPCFSWRGGSSPWCHFVCFSKKNPGNQAKQFHPWKFFPAFSHLRWTGSNRQ